MVWTKNHEVRDIVTAGDRLHGVWGGGSILLVCLVIPATAAGQTVGILPVSGHRTLAGQLDSGLKPKLAHTIDHTLIDPGELRTRLTRAPGVAAAVDSARSWVVQAEQKLLHMKRQQAIDAAKEAISPLLAVGGRYHAPRLFSRANLVLARALLLKPSDPKAARVALQTALEATPNLVLEQLPPKAARLARQVRGEASPDNPPSEEELATICKLSEVSSLVWIAVRPDGENVQVDLLVHVRGEQVLSQRQRKEVAPDRLLQDVSDMIADALGKTGAVAEATSRPSSTTQGGKARPWYRTWWVWTLVGAAVAGATVGVVLATRDSDDESYRITFRF
jgi:hypothetical protein